MRDFHELLDMLSRIALAIVLAFLLCAILTLFVGCHSASKSINEKFSTIDTSSVEIKSDKTIEQSCFVSLVDEKIDSSITIETFFDTLGRAVMTRENRSWSSRHVDNNKKDTASIGETLYSSKRNSTHNYNTCKTEEVVVPYRVHAIMILPIAILVILIFYIIYRLKHK